MYVTFQERPKKQLRTPSLASADRGPTPKASPSPRHSVSSPSKAGSCPLRDISFANADKAMTITARPTYLELTISSWWQVNQSQFIDGETSFAFSNASSVLIQIDFIRFYLNKDWYCVGKRETSFPVNKLWLICLPPSLWPLTMKNRYASKFSSSQKNESRKQADSSEACRKAKVFTVYEH